MTYMPWISAAILLMILPFIFTNNSSITIMSQMWITVIFALAYNMLLGQGGMLSFGHAVYMWLGGFFCMHIMNYVEDFGLALPLPLLAMYGGVFGMGVAMLIGAVSATGRRDCVLVARCAWAGARRTVRGVRAGAPSG